jgi:hypothetical protein
MMGVRQNIDQHLPNRLYLDGLKPPLGAVYRDGYHGISDGIRWRRMDFIIVHALMDRAAVDLRAIQL